MKTYKQFAEQEGVRRVDFVDGITGEKETMNEILPAIAGIAKAAVGAARVGAAVVKHAPKIARVAKAGARVAGTVGKGAARLAGKAAKTAVKTGANMAADAAANKNEREAQQKAYKDKQKPQAKKDRDAMGRHESVEEDTASIDVKRDRIRKQREKMGMAPKKKTTASEPQKKSMWGKAGQAAARAGGYKLMNGEETMKKSIEEVAFDVMSEKRKETPDEWMKRTGKKPTTVKGGLGSAGKKQIAQFKKKYGTMKSREDELDARDKAEREKNNAEEMAYEMNSYVKTLAQDRYKNLWAEATKAKEGEDPEPVKGKKTMTGEKQEGVKINPKEAMPAPGPKIGALT